MNPSQMLEQLNALLTLPAETEWVEFKEAKNDYSFEKLGKYFSALSNEAALAGRSQGWLVFGVNNQHQVVGNHYRNSRSHLDKLKKEIADKTNNRLSFIEIHELFHTQGRVLMFEIPAALPGVPTTWEGHSYGREGESLAPLSLSELDRMRARSVPDWSAQIVEEATLEDLDPATPLQLEELLMDKLPDLLDVDQKKNKIRNLLQELARKDGSVMNVGGRGSNARWVLKT